jgi:hypothetical protein
MNIVPSTTQLKTIGFTLLVIALINKVDALKPVKQAVLDDGTWF